ncbi:pyridoxamine 5'-phosphate oxidase family protein [Rugamonas apoptosis]|uniref:pyridoxamine 5'-phosphate oxidase family protein n=1 Tax=Rugamonas apoptosis TaxID=2758570 RepID=UPI001E4D5756|nr:pyridoxamine 5'-phosphate oxidase family protein [Rugamonas apoptosis]
MDGPLRGPFHPGELRAQQLAGKGSSGGAIRDHMPDQHREFFAMLPFVLLATVGEDGWPQAAVLSGAPGFVSSPDATTLRVAAPLGAPAGTRVGLLGLDFGTRRRNRANGSITQADGQGFTITVDESFGNCPKYIRLRDVTPAEEEGGALSATAFEGLSEQARRMVASADTFFVATTGGQYGADISHRGGEPGFVRIAGDTLTVPDYAGNRYFNTLGNMLVDARTALLLIDYASGDVLHLQGRAVVEWDGAAAGLPGAERLWHFRVERGTLRPAAVPLRWRLRPDD